jgi:hypothetical protein
MKVETKTEEINWDKPQLVVSGKTVVRTNEKHDGECFEGIDMLFASEESYSQRWIKSSFKPFHGTISNDGIKHEEPKFQPVTITIESEEELCDMWHRMNQSASEVNGNVSKKLKYNAMGIYDTWDKLDEIVKQRNLYK